MSERPAEVMGAAIATGGLGLVWIIIRLIPSVSSFGPDIGALAYVVGGVAFLCGVGVEFGSLLAYIGALGIAIYSLAYYPIGTVYGAFALVLLVYRETREYVVDSQGLRPSLLVQISAAAFHRGRS